MKKKKDHFDKLVKKAEKQLKKDAGASAICPICGQDMASAEGCATGKINDTEERCPDCGALPGRYHHAYCEANVNDHDTDEAGDGLTFLCEVITKEFNDAVEMMDAGNAEPKEEEARVVEAISKSLGTTCTEETPILFMIRGFYWGFSRGFDFAARMKKAGKAKRKGKK